MGQARNPAPYDKKGIAVFAAAAAVIYFAHKAFVSLLPQLPACCGMAFGTLLLLCYMFMMWRMWKAR